MQDMAKSISFRWDEGFIAEIDKARGDIPRSAFVRRCVAKELAPRFEAKARESARRVLATRATPVSGTLDVVTDPLGQPVLHGTVDAPFAGAGSPVDLERHVQVSPKLTTAGIKPQPKRKL